MYKHNLSFPTIIFFFCQIYENSIYMYIYMYIKSLYASYRNIAVNQMCFFFQFEIQLMFSYILNVGN